MAIDFKNLLTVLPLVTDAGHPVLLRGRHGIGKSSVVYQYAESLGMPIVERRASQMTEGDLLGLPTVDEGVTSFCPPDWFATACDNGVVLFLDEVADKGFEIIAYDYPGYGVSGGEPGEEGCYEAIEAVYRHMTGELSIDPSNVVLWGRSLGTGPSCHLAATSRVAGILLETPFLSAFRTLTEIPVLPWDRFRNLEKIPDIHCPSSDRPPLNQTQQRSLRIAMLFSGFCRTQAVADRPPSDIPSTAR